MRLSLAERKFLYLAVAAIAVVQAGRATLLHADPPPQHARLEAAVGAEDGGADFSVAFEDSGDPAIMQDAFTEADWLAIELGVEGWAGRAADATQCTPSATSTGPGVWVSNTSDPYYASFRFPIQLDCTPVAGATVACEPFVIVSVTYKMIGGTWTSIGTGPAASLPLQCNQVANGYAFSPSTIDIVTGPNGGTGSYRSTIFVYRQSGYFAANWSAFLTSNFYDWTF